jgi:UDP-glucose 4-epimerase
MNIVVTGGLGHIGSRLIREIPRLFDDAGVVIVDNLSTQRYYSLFNLPQGVRYRFVEGDITIMDLEGVLAGANAVVHLAALTDAAASFDHPDAIEKVNFAATKRIAEACAGANVPLIHVSSTSVYATKKSSIDEDCEPEDIAPQSPYAHSKYREEQLVQEMSAAGALKAMTFRFGSIFGVSPGMRFHTAVNRFCWQAAMGAPLSVWETAWDQRRPYLDLADAVRAIAFVIQRHMFDGRIYNAVTVNATVRELVESIRRFSPELVVNFVESRAMNSLSYEIRNTRLSSVGFSMQGSMDRGISDTLHLLMHAGARTA